MGFPIKQANEITYIWLQYSYYFIIFYAFFFK